MVSLPGLAAVWKNPRLARGFVRLARQCRLRRSPSVEGIRKDGAVVVENVRKFLMRMLGDLWQIATEEKAKEQGNKEREVYWDKILENIERTEKKIAEKMRSE